MELTHWKKMRNPDYLGAYALTPGQDLIVTIKNVRNEMVTSSDGKKEECTVIHFVENDIKPMIANATNLKTITKLFKTPYVEQWQGQKIQLFIDHVKAFGDTVEALRVRSFAPKIVSEKPICSDCKKEISAVEKMNAAQMAGYTQKKYGRMLCAECATKLAETQKNEGAL